MSADDNITRECFATKNDAVKVILKKSFTSTLLLYGRKHDFLCLLVNSQQRWVWGTKHNSVAKQKEQMIYQTTQKLHCDERLAKRHSLNNLNI